MSSSDAVGRYKIILVMKKRREEEKGHIQNQIRRKCRTKIKISKKLYKRNEKHKFESD
jgi:hypothetical protein